MKMTIPLRYLALAPPPPKKLDWQSCRDPGIRRSVYARSRTMRKPLPELYEGRTWTVDDPGPYGQVEAKEVGPGEVNDVVASWTQVEEINNHLAVVGELLMRKIFELHPPFRVQFGFQANTDPDDPVVYQDPTFVAHGMAGWRSLGQSNRPFHALGPDREPLESELNEIGRRHIHMNALPDHWPIFEEALLFYALKELLGSAFNEKVKKSWKVFYHFLVYQVIMGLLAELLERTAETSSRSNTIDTAKFVHKVRKRLY